MKKMISLLLAAAMILSLGVAAFATDTTINQETTDGGETKVSYTIAESAETGVYTVTIPASVTADPSKGTSLPISASDVTLLVSKKLTIKVASKNNYILKKDNSNSAIAYSCTVGENQTAIPDTGIILEVTGTGTLTPASDSTSLNISTTTEEINKATETGEHYDILTFTCEVTDA